jgi:hypothetical protein
VVSHLIGNLAAKFNNKFGEIMAGIVCKKTGYSKAKKKWGETKNSLKFEIQVPIQGLR